MQTTASFPSLDARVRLFHSGGGKSELLAFADLMISGAFVIKGIRVVAVKAGEKLSEPFISFPSRKGSGGERYFDVAHPITTQAHQEAKEIILRRYREAANSA